MTRQQYLTLLANLVRRKRITMRQAAALLRRFDSGQLATLPALPTSLATTAQLVSQALAALGLAPTARLSLHQREQLRERIQAAFEARAGTLANQVMAGALEIAVWQARMTALMAQAMSQQYAAGLGEALPDEAIPQPLINRQAVYLYRYAGDLHAARETGQVISQAAAANRSLLYGGASLGAWYRGNEQPRRRAGIEGWVVEYIDQDSPLTCAPCHGAAGFYLPGLGPMPGEVCLGKGRCKCRRVERYLPERYNELARLEGRSQALLTG